MSQDPPGDPSGRSQPGTEPGQSSAGVEAVLEDLWMAIVACRTRMDVPAKRPTDVTLRVPPQWRTPLLRAAPSLTQRPEIGRLTVATGPPRPSPSVSAVVGEIVLFVHLEGVIDVGPRRERLRKELGRVVRSLARGNKRLANEDFLRKAKAEAVEAERDRVETLREERSLLDRTLSDLED